LEGSQGVEFVESDYDFAKKVALGIEQSPEGVSRSAIDHAVAEKAKEVGDYELQARVETAHSLHLTRAGQEIALEKGRVNDNSPEQFIKQLMDYRINGAAKLHMRISEKTYTAKKAFMKRVEKETTDLKERLTEKSIPKKKANAISKAQDILDLLTCK
jgi:flagellin-specific chaperone FliS